MSAAIPTLRHPAPLPQRGFSLIELIVVVVVLGILAVTALPRLASLTGESHRSVLAGIAASFRSAVSLANSACILRNFAGRDDLPVFGTGNVDFNANCFPSSTSGNNNLNINANRCIQVWNGILSPAPTISTPAVDTTDFRAQGGGTTCSYTYRDDTDTLRRFTYNAATGAISVVNP